MAREIPDLTKPSVLCSFHSPDGLEYVPASSTPAAIQLKLRNLTKDSWPLASGGAAVAGIQIDFSAAGGAVTYTSVTPCAGFQEASFTGNVLTLQLAYSQLWWYPGIVWTIKFDGFSIDAPAGLGSVAITFTGIVPESATNVVHVPLMRLAPSTGAKVPRLVGGWGKGGNRVQVTASGQSVATSTLELEVLAPNGVQAEISPSSGVYLGFLSGNWPSLPAVTSPSDAAKTNLDALAANWGASNLSRTRMPLWRLAPKGNAVISSGTGQSTSFRLGNLTSRQKPGCGYMVLYSYDVPGFDDTAAVLQAALDSGPVQITSFTATPTSYSDITQAMPVTLQWAVVNSSAVLLTGYGSVPASGTETPNIECTTTYVLTALDASMSTAVSQSIQVAVTPDLVTRLVPPGVIVPWSGSSGAPAGWSICDGTNGTPDLTDRFIVGVGTEPVNQSGAGDTHTHPVAALSGNFTTSSDGQHSHGMPTNWYSRSLSSGDNSSIDTNGDYSSNTHTQSDSNHTHSVAVTIPAFNTDANAAPTMPAWYALYFIVKNS